MRVTIGRALALYAGAATLLAAATACNREQRRFREALTSARDRRAGLWAENGFECRPEDHRRKRC